MIYSRTDTRLDVTTVTLDVEAGVGPLWVGTGWLMGWIVAEATGNAPASLLLVDGADAGGSLIGQLNVLAAANSTQHAGDPGWPLEAGLFVGVLSGAVTASFTIGRQLA